MLKKVISVVTMACVITSALSFNVFAKNVPTVHTSKRFDKTINMNTGPRKPGQLIVKYKNNESLKANKSNIARNNGKILKSDDTGLALVQVEENKLTEKMELFENNSNVEYVAPNYIRKALEFPEDAPNDPLYDSQWGLQSINAPTAWVSLGDTSQLEEVVVAVIDTGLDGKHEDLKDRVVEGYDFVDMDEDPSPGPINEEHATHVAGVIAASTDNKQGVSGTAGKAPVKIMPLRVLEAGSGDDFTIAQAIFYAADNGAKVINMSLGGYGDSPLLTEACNYAFSKNVVVVAAAGNSSMDAANFSPACIPGVITVAATDMQNSLAEFSNYGSTVEISAPGVNIMSTLPGNEYEAYDGTSIAAPFVSAACALVISKNPSLSLIEVEQYLTDSALDLGSKGKDNKFGYGLLDLDNALNTTEITPRLEIMNLDNSSTVYDLLEVQTRFTYPEKIVTTDLYIDDTVVQSVYNQSNFMFTTFEIDTYKLKDGKHTLTVVANDIENQTYSKEISVNVRNTVYTGLRVKLTHDDVPVTAGYVEVWNKYTLKGETYYDFIYSGITSKTGVAIVPGSRAPNGNQYIIIANYAIDNGNDEYSYASLIEEATAPGIIEMDGRDLIPVTIDTGLTSEIQNVFSNYTFPGSNQTFSFSMPQTSTDGSFEAFLNPGTYSFTAYAADIDKENSQISTEEPMYFLSSEEVEIDSGNFYVALDSDINNLAKVDLKYKRIHGFTPDYSIIAISRTGENISYGFAFEDITKLPDIYMTPDEYSYSFDIIGQKDNQMAYLSLQGTINDLEADCETSLSFGGTFTGKIKLDKNKYLPGEYLNIDSSITDSYGNKLVYMDYIYDNLFVNLSSKSILSYKTGSQKVKFKVSDTSRKVMADPTEPIDPEEPIEVEYTMPISLELVDSKNNVIKSEYQFMIGWMYFDLPQNIMSGKYKLKLIVELPYLIQAEATLNATREFKDNAVKFTIELPDKTKATWGSVEAFNTTTGEYYSSTSGELLNGEFFLTLPKGNYNFTINTATDDGKPVMYFKNGKAPANHTLSASTLQSVNFTAKDEGGKILNSPTAYYVTLPGSTTPYLLGYSDADMAMTDVYLSKGTYNFVAEVYNLKTKNIERILSQPNVNIAAKSKTKQKVEFSSKNLTEVTLGKTTNFDYVVAYITDAKTGIASMFELSRNYSIKIPKGFYTLEAICEKTQYENTYIYYTTTQKEFSGPSTNLNFSNDFSMSITPNKATYKTGETLKTTNVISDRYGNRVISLWGTSSIGFLSEILKADKGKIILKKDKGEIKLFDLETEDYIDIPYYDINAPFISIIDSLGDVVFSAKSPDFYTQSQIKLSSDWIDKGNYKVVMTVDIDADGDQCAEASFKVK